MRLDDWRSACAFADRRAQIAARSHLQLACLNTGIINGLAFESTQAWVGFIVRRCDVIELTIQTGSTIQLGMLLPDTRSYGLQDTYKVHPWPTRVI